MTHEPGYMHMTDTFPLNYLILVITVLKPESKSPFREGTTNVPKSKSTSLVDDLRCLDSSSDPLFINFYNIGGLYPKSVEYHLPFKLHLLFLTKTGF